MKRYFDGTNTDNNWSDYPGVGKVYDKDVAEFTVEHLTLFDRFFNPKKITMAAIAAQLMKFGVIDTPEGNFKW